MGYLILRVDADTSCDEFSQKFATLTSSSACTAGEDACVQGKFAQCVSGKFVLQSCAPGTM